MGELVQPEIDLVRPLDIVLVRYDFKRLLEAYDGGTFQDLLPCVVAKIPPSYAVIDGAHRTIIYALSGENPRLYVPSNNKDFMVPADFPRAAPESLEEANRAVGRLDTTPERLASVEGLGIMSFGDLMDEYSIHSMDDLRKFVEGSITHKWARTSRGDGY